jgi:hypothetical protein
MGSIITPSRRGFLVGLGTALATPFIVRASSIMPVKSLPPEMLKNPARNYHLVSITRGGEDIVILVDGQLVEPGDIERRGSHVRVLSRRLQMWAPPGSHQQMTLREYA